MVKNQIKINNVNSDKRMLEGYIRQYSQNYNTFSDGRIRQIMHQTACIYIVVPRQKWNNNYLENR